MMYKIAKTRHLVLLLAGIGALSSCSKAPPPRTTLEFMDDARLLEATMVRCAANRMELKYDQECVNAREAVERLAAREDAEKRTLLEAESSRKREALRRAQQAASEARARAEEAERLRSEAEYLQQFDELPGPDEENLPQPAAGEIPAPDQTGATPSAETDSSATLDEVREELRKRQQPEN